LIVGLTKHSRIVLFSDSLLAQMGPSELAAVFAHEMGHAFRRHVPIFAAFVLGFVMLGDLIAQQWFADSELWAGALMLGILGIGLLVFGWLSRRFELEADLFSLDVLGEVRSLMSALEKVGGQLRDIAGWRHFSTADRVAFLQRAEADPNVGRRLRRDLRRFTYAGIALFVVTGVLQIARLTGSYVEDEASAPIEKSIRICAPPSSWRTSRAPIRRRRHSRVARWTN
jgi:Zn-dependent protease with chaperone function